MLLLLNGWLMVENIMDKSQMASRTPSLDHCYCPGCAKRILKRNYPTTGATIVSTDHPICHEEALLKGVLSLAEKSKLSSISAIGVLATAAVMMISQTYDLTYLAEEEPSAQEYNG